MKVWTDRELLIDEIYNELHEAINDNEDEITENVAERILDSILALQAEQLEQKA